MNTRNRLLALLIVVILLLSGAVATIPNLNTPQGTLTNDPQNPAVTPVIFPTVPQGGTVLTPESTFFHPSGLISTPKLVGYEPNQQGSIETVLPSGNSTITRAGVTLVNNSTLSVVHTFAERDTARRFGNADELHKGYTKELLDGAWKQFTGGYKELNRRVENNLSIINFELYLASNTYLGRQVSKINGEWTQTLRLVVPSNNPPLLDTLQNLVFPRFQLWSQVLSTPFNWGVVADYATGYAIKYPVGWQQVDGAPGRPYTVNGNLGTIATTLSTRMQSGKPLNSEDEVRKFIADNFGNPPIKSVRAATVSEAKGFAVSYTSPDRDGNKRSAVTTVINAPNERLVLATLVYGAPDLDLLDPANSAIPTELTQIRNSLFLLPTDQFVPTAVPQQPTAAPQTTPGS